MKTFITDDFMLQNDTARELYHSYAKEMPIFDFHCHLPPKEIAENSRYSSITDVWLGATTISGGRCAPTELTSVR